MAVEYEKMSLVQLKELAREMGLKKTTQLRKNELIELLQQNGTQGGALVGAADEKEAAEEEKKPEEQKLDKQEAQADPIIQEAAENSGKENRGKPQIERPRRGRPRKKVMTESEENGEKETDISGKDSADAAEPETYEEPAKENTVQVFDGEPEEEQKKETAENAESAGEGGEQESKAEEKPVDKSSQKSDDRTQEERPARTERPDYQSRRSEYAHNREYRQGYRQDYNRSEYSRQDNNRQEYSRPDYKRQDYNRSEYSRQDNNRQEYSRSDNNRQDNNRQDNNRQEYSRSDYNRQDNNRQEYNRTDYSRPDNNRQDYGRSDYSRPDNNRQDNSRPDNNRQDNNRQDYNRQDYNRTDYNRQDSSRQEYGRADNTRTDNSRQENRTDGSRTDYIRPEGTPDYKKPEDRLAESKGGVPTEMAELDSGETKEGILEVMADGYGFIRCDNYLPGENDVYVSPAQIRRFNLKTGDIIVGNTRIRSQNEKFSALLYVKSVNGFHPSEAQKRKKFEDLTPVFPKERIYMETPDCSITMRMIDIFSPIGKGQRGMIVSQPKAGKTTILKQIAGSITKNYPDMNLIILLIDERPEEVTDIKESIEGENVEVIYSTFDELPENHKRVSEMVIERAKRLVEHKKDVVILLDSITRLARAYNLTIQPSGRTLSDGLDPAALYMPKRFFGAARNMREGGSLTVLATALVDTGSRMDDVVFEEFKGTGNMEIVLDRSLSEKRIFPAIDLLKSSTRRDDLLLEPVFFESANVMRRWLSGQRPEEALEHIINIFTKTKNNNEFIKVLIKSKMPEKLI
ncbi:MAG: transcription termination factor Rho [Lachnospiraceae bacterium]|nr:transcription termination factor Rho [Lachnospiraceae bacterium]